MGEMKPRSGLEKELSDSLIARGIYPGKKMYASVKPRGIYKLFPSRWREAKELEGISDMAYYEMMNQCKIAIAESKYSTAPKPQQGGK